jgi:hypothetical protein
MNYFESSDIIYVDGEGYDVEYGCRVDIIWRRGYAKSEVDYVMTILKVGEVPYTWLNEEMQKKVDAAFRPDVVFEIKERYGLAA